MSLNKNFESPFKKVGYDERHDWKYCLDLRIGKIEGDQEIIAVDVADNYYGDWLVGLSHRTKSPLKYILELVSQTNRDKISSGWQKYFLMIGTHDADYQQKIKSLLIDSIDSKSV